MISHISRIFGMGRLDLAEDVVQDTLCRAFETWSIRGIPENPSAWLMRAARNRAIDFIRKDKQLQYFTPELIEILNSREDSPESLVEQELQDDQLRMMLACCHPKLSSEAQIPLILKTLCGFSVSEIAHALLTTEDAIEKRLGRARKLLRESGFSVEITRVHEIAERLEPLYHTIYILFNEGYHASQSEQTIREDLCFEAIRLALLLSEHPQSRKPKTFALLALLCFHASRLAGRIDDDGNLLQLQMQDRSKWDQHLIGQGFYFLQQSTIGNELSDIHVEAAIASIHCSAAQYEDTNWNKIRELYDTLYRLKPSPIIALNRAVASGKANGPVQGLAELDAIADRDKLKHYPFFHGAYAELYQLQGRKPEAAEHFAQALKLARTTREQVFFERKLRDL